MNTFAQNAKAYWRLWGPLGEPMVRVVDAWVEQQRAYVQWLRENYGRRRGPSLLSNWEQRAAGPGALLCEAPALFVVRFPSPRLVGIVHLHQVPVL